MDRKRERFRWAERERFRWAERQMASHWESQLGAKCTLHSTWGKETQNWFKQQLRSNFRQQV